MSVQQNHYVIYGYSIQWENTDHLASKNNDEENKLFEAFNKYSDSAFKEAKPNTFLILDDGMSGNYLLIGICLASTSDYGGFDDVIECSVSSKNKKLLKESITKLKEELPSYYNLETKMNNLKPKVYTLTHYR
jgi:hypothetical protein